MLLILVISIVALVLTSSYALFSFGEKGKVENKLDTINEFLSLMAPPKAPYLLSIDSSQSGSTGKLSFDSTHQIPGYYYNNNLINSVVSKNAYCLGIFNGSTTISGTLNSAVSADPSSAWPANSFPVSSRPASRIEYESFPSNS